MDFKLTSTTTINHPALGRVVGREGDEVSQFLGIKYATLKHPFGQPKLYDGPAKPGYGSIDATKHGPSAPACPDCCAGEWGLIQQSLEPHPEVFSELDCLNLNITVPVQATPASALPVLVWIHGGGFNLGSNAWPQYDHARFVELAASKDLPVMVVGINYRLGRWGFAAAKELEQRGFLPNNGLRDQRTAFLWIQKHIAGFGGDPNRVTVLGQSAGGMSVTLQLQSEEPLFDQLISMGGQCLMRPCPPPPAGEAAYERLVKVLRLETLSPDERIAGIAKSCPKIAQKLGPQFPLPVVVDGDIVKKSPTYEHFSSTDNASLPGKQWCKNIFIGCSSWDVSIFSMGLFKAKDKLASLFISTIQEAYPNDTDAVSELLSDYGIGSSTPPDQAATAVLQFFQDVTFEAPVTSIASTWPGSAFVYRFREGNPWPGPWQGSATHILEVALLWQNYREKLPAEVQKVAEAFAEDVIRFTHGLAPSVKEYQDADKEVRLYGPDGLIGTESTEKAEVGSNRILKFKDTLGMEKLVALLGPLMGKVAAAAA